MATGKIKKPFSSNDFVVENVYIVTNLEVAGGANVNPTDVTATKTGYYPIGIVGVISSSLSVAPTRYYLSSRSSGSCVIETRLRNIATSSTTLNFSVNVLWVKEG